MLRLDQEHVDEMVAHSLDENPNECCGILAGTDGVVSRLYRITNTVRSPSRYLMDSQEQLDAMLDSERNGREVIAFYHSHTHGPPYPSHTDVRMALESGWIDVIYVLVSLENRFSPTIGVFRIGDDGGILEEDYEVV